MAARLLRSGGRGTFYSPHLQRMPGFSSSTGAVRPASSAAEISAAASTLKPEEAGKKWGLSVLVLLVPCAATFGLGSWQLIRREKKIELLNFRRERFEEDPIALEEALSIKSQNAESVSDVLQYRKVHCEGILDESRSLFVGPRSRTLYGAAEKGYYMITPLICKSKDDDRVQLPVLVNQGWVPSSTRNQALKQEQPIHVVVKSAPEEKKVKQSSWWGGWGKPQATEKVMILSEVVFI